MTARGWVAFAACSVIWGVPYLFIKVAVDDGVPPVFVAWSRMVLGAAVLLALGWRAGVLGQVRGRWGWIAIYAVLELAIPFPLIALGEQHVSSSLAAILIAAVPLFVALLALRFDHEERAEGRRLVGLFVGLGGVVALMGIDVAGRTDELLGALAVLVAAVGYAAGPMLLKRKLAGIDPRAVMGAALVVAAGVLTPLVAVSPPDAAPSADGWISLVVLGVVCTALGLVVFAVLIAEVGPGRGLVITYVNPLVAVALGVTLLGERPGAGAVAGLLLILAGSWLSTGGTSGSSGIRAPRARSDSDAVAAIDAAEPGRGAPAEALDRLVGAWWDSVSRHARVIEALATAFPDHAELHDFHSPIVERVERLVRRGRRSGAFDRDVPVAWTVAAFLGLMHSAAQEVAAGRLDRAEAGRALRRTIPRLFGFDAPM